MAAQKIDAQTIGVAQTDADRYQESIDSMGEIITVSRRISTEILQKRAARAASGFASLRIGRGDTVALYLRNDICFFEASYAAGLVGAYPTPVNWHYTEEEVRYLIENSGARVIVVHADLTKLLPSTLPQGTAVLVVGVTPEVRDAYRIPAETCDVPSGMIDWSLWLDSFDVYKEIPAAAPGTIIYTSGTTGRPKGVRRNPPTHEQAIVADRILSRGFGFAGYMDDPSRIVTVVTGPLYHTSPNLYGLMAARLGAQVVLQPRFDPEDLLRLIEEYRVTHLHMVPIMFNRLLALLDEIKNKYDLSSLRFVVHAAAPCPVRIKHAMIEWWGPVINEYYGSTETGILTFCTAQEWLAHPGTVGRPLPEVEMRVIDANGASLPTRGIGEIVAKSTIADFTYHGDDDKRRAAEKVGLIAPGDIGYLDEDGFLYLCDRAKDMIISGGAKIYPAQIEAELQRMPGVADCGIFGIPDDEYGEAIYAAVQLQPGVKITQAEVTAFLRAHVAGYAIPRQIQFYGELPREDSGKIFKRKLREPFWRGHHRQI